LVLHANNARPHIAVISSSILEEKGMTRADHSTYSPDAAPSRFYLFGYIKRRLSGTSFDEGGDLLSAVEDILCAMEKSTFHSVLLERMERVQRCIDANCDSVG
jgi:hypothetical protein